MRESNSLLTGTLGDTGCAGCLQWSPKTKREGDRDRKESYSQLDIYCMYRKRGKRSDILHDAYSKYFVMSSVISYIRLLPVLSLRYTVNMQKPLAQQLIFCRMYWFQTMEWHFHQLSSGGSQKAIESVSRFVHYTIQRSINKGTNDSGKQEILVPFEGRLLDNEEF